MTKEAKRMQENTNYLCKQVLDNFRAYVKNNPCTFPPMKEKRVRSCNAYAQFYGGDYIVLKSYNTIVAIIDVNCGIMVDVLRYVYGYTSTSCQHISKFAHDYSSCYNKYYRYYPV